MNTEQQTFTPPYDELFSRNLGIVSPKEQTILSNSCVAIAGVGGVGGSYALTLARMGVGHFHLADFDRFEACNFNRQRGAYTDTIGRFKTEVIREHILKINPFAKVKNFGLGINSHNISEFLESVDLVMDGIDVFAVNSRRLLHISCEDRGIYVIASGPVGLTATLHVFGPGSMSFEAYFDFISCNTFEEQVVAFLVGTCPSQLHYGQIDSHFVNLTEKRGPSIAAAIELCAGIACAEAMTILTKRDNLFLAPRYLQFDMVKKRLAKKYLFWGNRNPLQKLKRYLTLKLYQKNC